MLQRIVTGVALAALLIAILLMEGWVLLVAVVLVAMIGCYEMQTAFEKAGLSPARITVYGTALLALPMYLALDVVGLYALSVTATMIIMLQIALRKEPKWIDAVASLNVLISVPIPLSLLYPIARTQPDALGTVLLFSVFVIAFAGDTFAYFGGVTLGKHPMAPLISPRKTWEGSVFGLLGSILGAMALWFIGNNFVAMPPIWHFLLLGLIGGVAGQLGDLSASLVKRFCNLKDYGTIFPGHGGMMDRMDSVIFVIYIILGYCLVAGFLGGV